MSDNAAVVSVRAVQRRRIKRPDIHCHLVTERRHEKEVISERRFQRRREMAARDEKKKKHQWERGSKRKG